jgi:beta-glucosidase
LTQETSSPKVVTFTQACNLEHNFDPPNNANPPLSPDDEVCGKPAPEDGTTISDAVDAAQSADQVVLALGENREMCGEANARSELDLPGQQEKLLDAIKATGKPFVVVLFNGRPLDLTEVAASSPAILEAWFPGVEGATQRPTSCSERSTPAASCRSPSRGGLARCRSTTTTSQPVARATRPSSGTHATAT